MEHGFVTASEEEATRGALTLRFKEEGPHTVVMGGDLKRLRLLVSQGWLDET
jgi:hypothetical protein